MLTVFAHQSHHHWQTPHHLPSTSMTALPNRPHQISPYEEPTQPPSPILTLADTITFYQAAFITSTTNALPGYAVLNPKLCPNPYLGQICDALNQPNLPSSTSLLHQLSYLINQNQNQKDASLQMSYSNQGKILPSKPILTFWNTPHNHLSQCNQSATQKQQPPPISTDTPTTIWWYKQTNGSHEPATQWISLHQFPNSNKDKNPC